MQPVHISASFLCVSLQACMYLDVPVSVCVCEERTYESGRFGPRGDDKAIKLYVSHINCFDLFFSLSDSWLNGNREHFTQLERMLESAKHEEMASVEINRGKCLSSMGSKQADLFPLCLCFSQKIAKKNAYIEHLF